MRNTHDTKAMSVLRTHTQADRLNTLSSMACNHKAEKRVFESAKKTTNNAKKHNSYWFISNHCIYRFK